MSSQMDSNTPGRQSPNQYDDEIDLREVLSILWEGKFKILVITLIFAVSSVIYAISIPNKYKAMVVLAPAHQSANSLSRSMGQLGGLASLAGVTLGGAGSGESQIAQQIMQSWSFIEGFVVDHGLADELAAVTGWDERTNQLLISGNSYSLETEKWLSDTDRPSSWELFQSFTGGLSVEEDRPTGLVTVSMEYYSPHIAKQWLDLYVTAINEHMRERQLARVTNNINYLQGQVEKTAIIEMQEVFYSIIEGQIKSKMLAAASPDYAFVTVSPSMVPEERSQPRRAMLCIAATLIGGMLSVLVVLAMHYARKSD